MKEKTVYVVRWMYRDIDGYEPNVWEDDIKTLWRVK